MSKMIFFHTRNGPFSERIISCNVGIRVHYATGGESTCIFPYRVSFAVKLLFENMNVSEMQFFASESMFLLLFFQ